MAILDQTIAMTAVHAVQQALAVLGSSGLAAFAILGVRWKFEETKALLERTLDKNQPDVADGEPVARLSVTHQFERAVGVVDQSLQEQVGAQKLQRDASEKLDAAEYSLHRLLDELSTVMPQLQKPGYAGTLQHERHGEAVEEMALAA